MKSSNVVTLNQPEPRPGGRREPIGVLDIGTSKMCCLVARLRGSAFELLSWSQGEVRHNTWHSKGKENVPASAARKRMLYLVGLGVEVETGLRAVGRATVRNRYAFEMARRVDRARKQLSAVAKAAPNVPEIGKMVELAYSAGLKLNNERSLTAAADGISKQLASITEKYDGSTMAALDSLIPGPDKFKGKAREAGASN